MKIFSYLVLASTFIVQISFAKETNARLAATMSGISKDVGVIQAPTKMEPADVKDANLLDGIVRARTATFLLQLSDAKKGTVVDGKLVADELTPPGIDKAPDVAAALKQYGDLLQLAQQKIAVAETAVATELAKKKEDRTYGALKTAVDDVLAVMKQGHTAFKPPKD